MSCKKGSFMFIRHNNPRDLTTKMLTEVCKDREIEPKLASLTGEELDSRTAHTTNKARLDIKARGVWERGQQGFLNPTFATISTSCCNSVT